MTTDFTKMMPYDTRVAQDMFKNQTAVAERLSKIVLESAEKSVDLSTKWTKRTLARLGEMVAVKPEPADYVKAMSDFAAAQMEEASEHLAAYVEIMKRAQMETIEVMLAAGKDMTAEATAAVRKATADVAAAAQKAGAEMTSAAKKAAAAAT